MIVLPGGMPHAEAGEREAAADAEDHVGVGEEALDRPRIGPPAAAERQRMVLGEGALALDGGGDRDVPGLGQRPAARPRPWRSARPGRRRSPGARRRPAPGRPRRPRRGSGPLRAVKLGVWTQSSGTSSFQTSTGTSISTGPGRPLRSWKKARRMHVGRRPAHGQRLGPLGDVPHVQGGVEVRIVVGQAAGIAGRDHQDRHGLGKRLGDAAEGVLGAGAVLHAEDPDLVARASPANRRRPCAGRCAPGAR